MAEKLTAQQKRWQRQDDAHVLATAQEIQNDPKRHAAAKKEAASIAKEHEKRTQAMKQVADKSKSTTKTQSNTKVPGKKK